jgi:hypothetical protein
MTREQLEQQAERNRAAVSDTLRELNDRLTPGEILDEVMCYMKGGGNEFLGNLGKQVTANPLPVTLIGAGLAWFLLAKNGGANTNGFSMTKPVGNGASYGKTTGSSMGETAGAAVNKIGDIASATADRVGEAGHAVGDAASSAYHQTADAFAMAKNSAIQAEESTLAGARSAIAFCQRQPLVLAGIGLAIGATIGAALPSTQMEDDLMGKASDEVKDSAKEMAVDQLDKAKAVGEKIGQALQEDDHRPNGGTERSARYSGLEASQ